MFIDMCEKIAITAEVVKAVRKSRAAQDATTRLEREATAFLARHGLNANGEKASIA